MPANRTRVRDTILPPARPTVEDDVDAGRWFPSYYGNRFKVSRQTGRLRDQESSAETFATLDEARAEAARRNGAAARRRAA